MVKQKILILVDDIDGSNADETVSFDLDGSSYEVDLNSSHAEELRAALRPYAEAARKVSSSRRVRKNSSLSRVSSVEVRAWATGQGLAVNSRGKIRADVLEQYHASH